MQQWNAAIAVGPFPSNNNRSHVTRTPSSRTGLVPSSNLTSLPGGLTIPQQAHLNHPPLELESPIAMHHAGASPQHQGTSYSPNAQTSSVCELPAEERVMHHSSPDDKNPNFCNGTWRTWPASSTRTHHSRAIARWEEVVPAGNGEVTFTPTTLLPHYTPGQV